MTPVDLRGKTAIVVGLGKSGLAAARVLRARGAKVVVNDQKPEAALEAAAAAARGLGAELVLGGHPDALFTSADLVVLSPGVPPLAPALAARARGAEVIPEVELAARLLRGTLVGITGSNGKSTVTTLVGQMAARDAERGGRPAFVGGNLGDALTLAVDTDAASERGIVVAELSSFQLEDASALRCHVAACLNVTDDHLDRHGTFAAYAAAKGRIFRMQSRGDHAVVPAGDALSLSLASAGPGTVHRFGAGGEVAVVDGHIRDRESGLAFPVAALRIQGLHNQANACAAALVARLAGLSRAAIEDVLGTFAGLPHRMVLVRELDGVAYYDDSKATNVGAAAAALDGLADRAGKVILLAGGVDKGGSYAPLRERLDRLGRAVVLLGQAAPLVRAAMAGSALELREAASMDEAVAHARALARPGDVVLLAPACASFDMFSGYAHRGDVFQAAVRALAPASGGA